MQEILFNIAMLECLKFCKENGIDSSNSRLGKDGRGYSYTLYRWDVPAVRLVTVTLHKSHVPTFMAHVPISKPSFIDQLEQHKTESGRFR